MPCGITVRAGTIAALANGLPGVALLVPVAFSSTPCHEGIYSELVLGLVEYFLGKGEFSIGIALITKTAKKVAGIAVACQEMRRTAAIATARAARSLPAKPSFGFSATAKTAMPKATRITMLARLAADQSQAGTRCPFRRRQRVVRVPASSASG